MNKTNTIQCTCRECGESVPVGAVNKDCYRYHLPSGEIVRLGKNTTQAEVDALNLLCECCYEEELKRKNTKTMETIYSYTRAQAIKDGVLFDVSEIAKIYGFKIHCAISIDVASALNFHNDESQFLLRAHLMGIAWEIRKSKANFDDSNQIEYKVPGLKTIFHIGPGDEGEPVLTWCSPSEL